MTGTILGILLIYSYGKVIVSQVASLLALLWLESVFYIALVFDIRCTRAPERDSM